jgi:hypothetical protein
VNGTVRAIAIDSGSIFAVGAFTQAGGVSRSRGAQFSATTGELGAWDPGLNAEAFAVAASGGSVFVGGNFSSPRSCLAGFGGASLSLTSWNPSPVASLSATCVYSMYLQGDTMFVGGDFTSMLGTTANARLAAVTTIGAGAATGFSPADPSGRVNSIVASGSTAYVGGSFTYFGAAPGTVRNRLAAMGSTNGTLTPWDPSGSNTVYAIKLVSGRAFVGGLFTSLGTTAATNLAAIDVTSSTPVAWSPSFNGAVHAIETDGVRVIAGGAFSTSVGGARPSIVLMTAP